jgi:hypothetical protein
VRFVSQDGVDDTVQVAFCAERARFYLACLARPDVRPRLRLSPPAVRDARLSSYVPVSLELTSALKLLLDVLGERADGYVVLLHCCSACWLTAFRVRVYVFLSMVDVFPDDFEDSSLRAAYNSCRVELGNVYRALAAEKKKLKVAFDYSAELAAARQWYTRALEYTMCEYR